MATVTAPLMSAEARGRVGGLVANTWRGISYFKHKVAPAQPRTELQMHVRSLAIKLTRKWQTLSSANRTTWTDYAAAHPLTNWTGSTKRLTGLNWYVACNVRLLLAGSADLATAPEASAPAPVSGLACTGGAAQISSAWDTPDGAGDRIEIFLDGPHSAGALGRLPRARHKAYFAGDGSPQVIATLQAGTYTVYARAFDLATGLVSTWVQDTATVT